MHDINSTFKTQCYKFFINKEQPKTVEEMNNIELNEAHIRLHSQFIKLIKILKHNKKFINTTEETKRTIIEKYSTELTKFHDEIVNELMERGILNCKCELQFNVPKFELLLSGDTGIRYKITKPIKCKYIIHEHKTIKKGMHAHYDLRIENIPNDKKFLSWVVTKNLPEKPGTKHLAIFSEPHDPKWYDDYDDVKIPEGQYGAGEVKAYSKGEIIKWSSDKYNIVFTIINDEKKKLKRGDTFVLHRIKYQQWVIFKVRDDKKYTDKMDKYE